METRDDCSLGLELLDELDVLLLRVLLAHPLVLVPRLPLVLALQIKHAWFGFRVVSDCRLLEQTVKLKIISSAFLFLSKFSTHPHPLHVPDSRF